MIASSSSLPTILSSGNDNGWGGSGALIAILALAFCGGGFGGGWGGRNGDREAIDNAELNQRIDNLGDRQDLARNLEESCKVNMNVSESKYDLATQIAQNRFDDAIGFKDVELQLAQCCCNQTASIQEATQKILDKLNVNEVKALEAKINDLQRQIPVGTYITYPSNLPIIPPVSAANYGYGGYGFGGCNGF